MSGLFKGLLHLILLRHINTHGKGPNHPVIFIPHPMTGKHNFDLSAVLLQIGVGNILANTCPEELGKYNPKGIPPGLRGIKTRKIPADNLVPCIPHFFKPVIADPNDPAYGIYGMKHHRGFMIDIPVTLFAEPQFPLHPLSPQYLLKCNPVQDQH